MTTVSMAIEIAKKEVGYREGYSNGHWNNQEKYADMVPGLEWVDDMAGAWCAVFVSWVYLKAGLPKDAYCTTASVAQARDWAKKNGRFSQYPAIGAMALFGTSGSEHTGIVYAYDDTYIYTVEGNTNADGSAEGNGVYLKKRERRSSRTYGYLYPKFPEGIVSADPDWKSQAPKPETPQPADPKPVAPKFPGASHFKLGVRDNWVTVLGKAMIKAGIAKHGDVDGYQAGPLFTEYDLANVRDFQRQQGWSGSDANGYPGPETWKRIFKKAGYAV
ncbi:peptidoglycan-binding protein [Streptomyces lasalocidi]|uniref:peptidoglycan-binding protein n=1 Tax=Streptomyces lasalocidi TaxID=324833 RepID=UPI00158161F9|nr:peptidoglycan-binding protein [Streptomyces lasalocidi]